MRIFDNVYEVESILERRKRDGKVEYLVKWQNFGHQHNSWVTSHNMACPSLIEDYEFTHSSEGYENFTPFDRGFEAEQILDVELGTRIRFLVKFFGKACNEWVDNIVMRKECPEILIDFYEKRILWTD